MWIKKTDYLIQYNNLLNLNIHILGLNIFLDKTINFWAKKIFSWIETFIYLHWNCNFYQLKLNFLYQENNFIEIIFIYGDRHSFVNY